jgi:hypothetical protein
LSARFIILLPPAGTKGIAAHAASIQASILALLIHSNQYFL